MAPWHHFWLCLAILSGSAIALDIPIDLGKSTSDLSDDSSVINDANYTSPDLVGVPFVTHLDNDDILEIPITGTINEESTPEGKQEKNVKDLMSILNMLVETKNTEIHDAAVLCASKHPGDLRIDQIYEIYSYLKFGDSKKDGWKYVKDARGIDSWNYANHSMKLGNMADCVGIGDCDDFAILMATFVESIGGSTRIIMANNNSTGGHAYAEVYLGQLNITGGQIERIIEWLQREAFTKKIYGHIDTDTKEVWLNLDWGKDERGYSYPGCPLFKGNIHYVLRIKEDYNQNPVKMPESINKPPRIISLLPDINSPQEAESVVTWIAEARDVDDNLLIYRFFLNGYPATEWTYNNSWEWTTTEHDIGDNEIEVHVKDGKHKTDFDSRTVAQFTITLPSQKLIIASASPSRADTQSHEIKNNNDSMDKYDPLSDEVYQGDSDQSYNIMGVQEAWDLIHYSNITLSEVHVGVISDGLYKGYGEFDRTNINTSLVIYPSSSPSLLDAPLFGWEIPGSLGTGCVNVIAADPDDGGLVGIASPLSLKGKLKIDMVNIFDSNRSFVSTSLLGIKAAIENGCTIICLPFGNSYTDEATTDLYERFFTNLSKNYPEILFICSAGNDGMEIDGCIRIPNGLPHGPLPNVITVGNIMNDGRICDSSNRNKGNNYVTLAAPGEQVPWGMDNYGNVVAEGGGTSIASAEVAAAAALIRSINPELLASDIKNILIETGHQDINGLMAPEELGGRVIAIDNAVKMALGERSPQIINNSVKIAISLPDGWDQMDI